MNSQESRSLQFVIITGLSGAGKTQAIRCLEDFGFFCVDNLPPALLRTFAELCHRSEGVRKVALVIDIRGGQFFGELFQALDALKELGQSYRILFLDADDETLVKRFKETRRRHPLQTGEEDLLQCIRAERVALAEIRERADLIINTSHTATRELRDQIAEAFLGSEKNGEILVNVVSFGFKYGIPLDADMVFDVRFLTNPHYVRELAQLDGTYQEVRDYVLRDALSREYMQRLCDFVGFSMPHFIAEGKAYLSIAIGCTGGQHRSVVVANELAQFLKDKGYRVNVHHRDIVRKRAEVTAPPSEAG
ncbi:MAG: RNase adapter RapZ [Abditibacteriales bacterium]|nr:RNase adapter RapZ [Abditibacteriales bacterium]MDW8365461.1 RNase adapter RapZ [Abditibacteriales bacterium]